MTTSTAQRTYTGLERLRDGYNQFNLLSNRTKRQNVQYLMRLCENYDTRYFSIEQIRSFVEDELVNLV